MKFVMLFAGCGPTPARSTRCERYKEIMQMMDFDPQKIGKSGAAYELVRDAYTNLLLSGAVA